MSLRLENSTDIFLELCLYANSEVFKIKALVYNTVIFVKIVDESIHSNKY